MDNSRMSTADMLQYCNEALAWDDFGPIDIFFFESVKKILLGQCSAIDDQEDVIDDLMGIERPVRDVELEPDYDKYADIYYGEEGDDDVPDYSRSDEDEAFDKAMFSGGFFDEAAAAAQEAEAALAAENAEAEAPAETAETTETAEPAAETAPAEAAETPAPAAEEAPAEAAPAEEPVKPAKKESKKSSAAAEKAPSKDKHSENKDGSFTVKI
ncbi:MAG: hypothetical protein IJM44_03885 [Ruminococcus sp.]|nr:hypothetical protein [Ruminococcus sp.]